MNLVDDCGFGYGYSYRGISSQDVIGERTLLVYATLL